MALAYDTEGLSIPILTPDVLSASLHTMMTGFLIPIPLQGAWVVSSPMMMTGFLTPIPSGGRSIEFLIFDTGIEYDLNSPDKLPDLWNYAILHENRASLPNISSNNAPGSTLYTFANGTPIPADYVCPIQRDLLPG